MLLLGGIGAIGAIIGGLSAAGEIAGAIEQRKTQERHFDRSLKFNRTQFGNRYGITMADMEKAGLNPILAYQQGAGSPPGAPTVPAFGNIAAGLSSSARSALTLGGDVRKGLAAAKTEQERARVASQQMDANLWKTVAEENALRSTRNLNEELKVKAKADADLSRASAKSVDTIRQLNETVIPAARAQEEFDKTEFGEKMRWLNRLMRAVTGSDQTSAK